ncbi:hypothetical protein [Vibrio sp. Evd11]|uniref:hypothetical protein n=1 Tax=Vibrio sp. Evd11 TaxID=1207404 RepID=UPI000EFB7010|nr:hypothetical protein [Vibrio sp. Evd11]
MYSKILESLSVNKKYIFATEEGRSSPIKVSQFIKQQLNLNENSTPLIAIYGDTKASSNVWSEKFGWNPSEYQRLVMSLLEMVCCTSTLPQYEAQIKESITLDLSVLDTVNNIISEKAGIKLVSTENGYLDVDVVGYGNIKRVTIDPKSKKAELLNVYHSDGSKTGGDFETDLMVTLQKLKETK